MGERTLKGYPSAAKRLPLFAELRLSRRRRIGVTLLIIVPCLAAFGGAAAALLAWVV